MRNWLSTIRVGSTLKVGAEIAGIAETPVRTRPRPIPAILAICAAGYDVGKGVETIDDGVAADSSWMPPALPDDDWSVEDRQIFFDDCAGIAEADGGLSRPEADEEQMARKQRSRGAS